MYLRTNKKTLQNISAAFKIIADGIEQIENMLQGYIPGYYSSNGLLTDSPTKNVITTSMNCLEQNLKYQGLTRPDTHLNYTAHESGHCIHIDIDPASVYRAVVMEWMEDPSQPQQDQPKQDPKDFGRWDQIPDYNPETHRLTTHQTTPPVNEYTGLDIKTGIDVVADVKERVVNFKLD